MLSSRPGILARATALSSLSPAAPRRLRRAHQSAPRASNGGDRPPPPPPPRMPEPGSSRSNAPVLYEEPPPPPPPPLPRFVSKMPTSRRNAVGASLLFVGALLGFSTVFSGDNDGEDAFFGEKPSGAGGNNSIDGPPYRIVDGRAFVRTSKGAILSVGRLPKELPDADRTLALMGEPGMFLLRLTPEAMQSVNLHGGEPLEAEGEFLTRVFATGDWEGALFRIAPSKGEIERIMRENGMDSAKEEAEELRAEREARARMMK